MLNWLKGLFGSSVASLPTAPPDLYPGMSWEQIADLFGAGDFARMRAAPRVMVLPFSSPSGKPGSDDPAGSALGAGVARMLIRDLGLVRNLVVRGPEDTPGIALQAVNERGLEALTCGETNLLGGVVAHAAGRFVGELLLLRPDGTAGSASAESDNLVGFLAACVNTALRLLGLQPMLPVADAWLAGRPPNVGVLSAYGDLRKLEAEDKGTVRDRTTEAARAMRTEFPEFALPGDIIYSDEDRNCRAALLSAWRTDPWDANRHFLIYCGTWKADGVNLRAAGWCARAIQLAPGHGKAHMCLPHSMPKVKSLIAHQELAYLLLPGNSFAKTNLMISLERFGGGEGRILELCDEGVAADPHDTGPLVQKFLVLERMDRFDEAIAIGRKILEMLEVMHPRTRYCLRQSPATARQMDDGTFNLPSLIGRYVEQCREYKRHGRPRN